MDPYFLVLRGRELRKFFERIQGIKLSLVPKHQRGVTTRLGMQQASSSWKALGVDVASNLGFYGSYKTVGPKGGVDKYKSAQIYG